MSQPTMTELQIAWTDAIENEDIPTTSLPTLTKLIEIRKKKTTWIGEFENNFRETLDDYIRFRSKM